MRIAREIAPKVLEALEKYPIVAISGPRQSGKTTLSQMIAPNYTYVNLEDLSLREFAISDPRGFLETYKGGAILDEIQYAPQLFSFLQVFTDARKQNGEYIITGSQNFLLLEKIEQSLAGRVALFNLLPFSVDELKRGNFHFPSWEEYLLFGSFPRKWMNEIDAFDFYGNYLRTYIERDVRLIKNIKNLDVFQKFVRLLAGRVGQLYNQSSLGNELGLDNKTVESWMNLLEVSFVAFRLRPYHSNFNKRLIKTPKVYFYDTGLLAFLLGIRSAETLNIHFAKGQLFENFIILEKMKHALNFSTHEQFYFWRDAQGNEIDLLIERESSLLAIEIKSGKTIHQDFFKSLRDFSKDKPHVTSFLVHGGLENQKRADATVLSFANLHEM